MRTRRNSVVLLAVLALVAVGSAVLHGGKVKAQTGAPGFIVTGAGPGGGPHVRLFNNQGQATAVSFFPYDPAFSGGVHVAMGDVDGDGFPEIITGAGAGGGPHVRVFKFNPVTGDVTPIAGVFAYDPTFSGGVFVAAGDLNGDGKDEIITGAGPGGGPHVRVWEYNNGALTPVAGFFAYAPQFAGGVHVGAGDTDGAGGEELITGAGAGGGPHVRWFSVNTTDGSVTNVGSTFAYDPLFSGGVYVAGRVGNDIVTGAGPGGGPHVRTFNGQTGQGTATSFFAYPTGFGGGVAVGGGDLNGDGADKIVTGAGPGGGPHVRVFDSTGAPQAVSFFPYDPAFGGGVFVAIGEVIPPPSTTTTTSCSTTTTGILPTLPTTTTTSGGTTTTTSCPTTTTAAPTTTTTAAATTTTGGGTTTTAGGTTTTAAPTTTTTAAPTTTTTSGGTTTTCVTVLPGVCGP